MRRVLLCLITLTFALNSASAQSPSPRHPKPMQEQLQRKEAPNPPKPYYCNSTQPTLGIPYPTLSAVPRTDGYVEYAGTLLTWTPNDNVTACNIRQIIFNVPDVMDNGSCPGENGVSPDIEIQLFLHGTSVAVKAAQLYDIVSEKNGPFIAYLIFAEAPDDLIGDYDFHISIVGHPKLPAPAK